MKFQGFKGLTKEEYTKELVTKYITVEHDVDDDSCGIKKGRQFAIIDRDSQRLIGDIYLKQDQEGPNQYCYWIGYTIHPDHSRRGYAFEVVDGVINYLKQQQQQNNHDDSNKTTNKLIIIKAGIDQNNSGSINLVKKLGFTYLNHEDGEDIYQLTL
ncbi:hypothetical protein PPL_01566 [Heterostelium album PN500]|uniref:N-acetyltransferase domain-containing protein n=1 Tax=Heterostelium pallidum (strain ATCC 26659 / Pp 5 / PN500) TaxID=670386 RepID=D3AZV2_HETP5|nr:hypothetical protein PPL_01566 [Heterostelium album PN500]EFA84576.1 hypothetical protein PPL_01566 [Heterostelium album PN500]|eukprot:XP_020436689.1 hypothetical protein PPL_01566 [Heterostelium album PN500]